MSEIQPEGDRPVQPAGSYSDGWRAASTYIAATIAGFIDRPDSIPGPWPDGVCDAFAVAADAAAAADQPRPAGSMPGPVPYGLLRAAVAAERRAVAEYGQSGTLCDPEGFDDELAEVADRAAATLRRFYEEARLGGPVDVPYTAVVELLAVVAALRGALGYPPSPTDREVFEQFKAEQMSTRPYDALRLHLICAHRDLDAPARPDREAEEFHARAHELIAAGASANAHLFDERTWDVGVLATRLAAVDEAHGRALLGRAVNDLVARHSTGQPFPEGGPGRG